MSGFVTTIATVLALFGGLTAEIWVPLTTCTPVAGVPPKVTVAPVAKFAPTIVTVVPPPVVPVLGLAEVTVGAGPELELVLPQAPE